MCLTCRVWFEYSHGMLLLIQFDIYKHFNLTEQHRNSMFSDYKSMLSRCFWRVFKASNTFQRFCTISQIIPKKNLAHVSNISQTCLYLVFTCAFCKIIARNFKRFLIVLYIAEYGYTIHSLWLFTNTSSLRPIRSVCTETNHSFLALLWKRIFIFNIIHFYLIADVTISTARQL